MPRLGYVSDTEITVEELQYFIEELKLAADRALQEIEVLKDTSDARKLSLNPGDKQCRFCRAKGICPALAGEVMSKVTTTVNDFDDLTEIKGQIGDEIAKSIALIDEGVVTPVQLAEFMNAADLIEDWLKGVRGRAEALMLEGLNAPGIVPGWMIAEGRRGNRAWTSVDMVEETMKSMRVKADEMYTRKLISPAAAEKLFGDSVRKWNKLKAMIFQPEGKPSVVPDNDKKKKRLVIKPVADGFDDLDANFDDLV